MPYKRKSYKKKSTSPSTRFLSQSAKALVTAQAALRLATQIKGLVNVEKHRHLVSTSSTNINTTGTVLYLAGISQGDDKADRSGNSILVKGISIKMRIQQSTTPQDTVIRIIWFIDLQQVADGSPAITDVLETNSTTAPLNRNNVGRFKILKQQYYNLQKANTSQVLVNKFIPLNHHIRYNGGSATDIQKGGIYMFILSDETTNLPTFVSDQIVQFYDN
jgi:hypothetical protein